MASLLPAGLLTLPARCRYLGQINPTDFFTRLLAGIVFTRLAPASFYKEPSGPDRHFDGMCGSHLKLAHI